MIPARAALPERQSLTAGPWMAAHALRNQVRSQAARQGLSSAEAEDLASEVVLRAGMRPDLRPENLHSWMHVVAQRLAIDVLRRRPDARLHARLLAHELDQPDPADAVADQSQAEWMTLKVDSLPVRQRTVLHGRAAGRSVPDLAGDLDMSYKAVESLTSRARSTMRAALAASVAAAAAVTGCLCRRAAVSAGAATVVLAAWSAVIAPAGPQAQDVQLASEPGATETAPAPPTASSPTPAVDQQHGRPVQDMLARTGRVQRTLPERQVVVSVPGQAVGPVAVSALIITRDREDETMLETLDRCLQEGVEVTAQRVGCPS